MKTSNTKNDAIFVPSPRYSSVTLARFANKKREETLDCVGICCRDVHSLALFYVASSFPFHAQFFYPYVSTAGARACFGHIVGSLFGDRCHMKKHKITIKFCSSVA